MTTARAMSRRRRHGWRQARARMAACLGDAIGVEGDELPSATGLLEYAVSPPATAAAATTANRDHGRGSGAIEPRPRNRDESSGVRVDRVERAPVFGRIEVRGRQRIAIEEEERLRRLYAGENRTQVIALEVAPGVVVAGGPGRAAEPCPLLAHPAVPFGGVQRAASERPHDDRLLGAVAIEG